jgi:hypothetical protein
LETAALEPIEDAVGRGLDPKNLHEVSRVFPPRPSARQRGVTKLMV